MFVVSVSKNKIKKSIITAIVVIVLSFSLVMLIKSVGNIQSSSTNVSSSLTVTSEEDLLKFISFHGWEVDTQPAEVRDVIIPETFDEVYANYNQIQIQQGFNLEKYAGQRVKRWTYIVRNYPETSPEDDYIRINILVSDNNVIGGDVCSVKLDGFMHGFSM